MDYPVRPALSTGFPTTCWSRVVAAGDRGAPESREALTELCRCVLVSALYFHPSQGAWPRPVARPDARLLRAITRTPDDRRGPADDGPFPHVSSHGLHPLPRSRREYHGAAVRGGGRNVLSIDARDAEGRYLREPFHNWTPERSFERDWALALLERVFASLRDEYERSDRKAIFETLKADSDRRAPICPAGRVGGPAREFRGGRPGRHPPAPQARIASTCSPRSPTRSPTKPRSKPSSGLCSPRWSGRPGQKTRRSLYGCGRIPGIYHLGSIDFEFLGGRVDAGITNLSELWSDRSTRPPRASALAVCWGWGSIARAWGDRRRAWRR